MQAWTTELKCKELRSKVWFVLLLLFSCYLSITAQGKSLTIMHLNDTHSRIEPFPESDDMFPNKGGVVRQYAFIEKVRKEKNNVLLLHCGDFVQGTPYFNVYKGETEMSVANLMKVDAACLGNHEFDNGLEALAKMVGMAQFPFISTNLDFTGTPMEGLTKSYVILERDGLKIGLIGLTIDTKGLVSKYNSQGVKYLNPIESANQTAAFLKENENCDLIVCLSHLGFYPNEDCIGDISLAKKSHNIDVILGGHTHTFMSHPERYPNLDVKELVVNQRGAYGIYIGRLDIVLEKE